jgi:hypothetical protein
MWLAVAVPRAATAAVVRVTDLNTADVTGKTTAESIDVARQASWPGYLGSPRQASAALGARTWRSFADAAVDHLFKILDGADPSQFQRYADLLERNLLFQTWIRAADERDRQLDAKQRAWTERTRR